MELCKAREVRPVVDTGARLRKRGVEKNGDHVALTYVVFYRHNGPGLLLCFIFTKGRAQHNLKKMPVSINALSLERIKYSKVVSGLSPSLHACEQSWLPLCNLERITIAT